MFASVLSSGKKVSISVQYSSNHAAISTRVPGFSLTLSISVRNGKILPSIFYRYRSIKSDSRMTVSGKQGSTFYYITGISRRIVMVVSVSCDRSSVSPYNVSNRLRIPPSMCLLISPSAPGVFSNIFSTLVMASG